MNVLRQKNQVDKKIISPKAFCSFITKNKSTNDSIYTSKQNKLYKQIKSKKHKWVQHLFLHLASDCFCHSICNIAKFELV